VNSEDGWQHQDVCVIYWNECSIVWWLRELNIAGFFFYIMCVTCYVSNDEKWIWSAAMETVQDISDKFG
jgi:hypothetical protein